MSYRVKIVIGESELNFTKSPRFGAAIHLLESAKFENYNEFRAAKEFRKKISTLKEAFALWNLECKVFLIQEVVIREL